MHVIKENRHIIASCVIGNMLEWYDFVLYSIFATILSREYFSGINKQYSLLITFFVFVLGYISRPIGGVIIGHYGDKYSRKKIMVITLLIMGIATTCIGLTPTYHSIGIAAPLIIMGLRIIQGLAMGGEFPGSMILMAENTQGSYWQRFAGTLTFVGGLTGFLLGSAIGSFILLFMSEQTLVAWGWRLPFLGGLLVAIVGIRLRIKYTPIDLVIKRARTPLVELLHCHSKSMLFVGLLLMPSALLQGFIFFYLPTQLARLTSLSLKQSVISYSFICFFLLCLTVIMGVIQSKFKKTSNITLVKYYYLSLVLFGIPIYAMTVDHNTLSVFIGVIMFSIILSGLIAPLTLIAVYTFQQHIRCSGLMLTYGVIFSLICATAPLVFNLFIDHVNRFAPGVYISLLALITSVVIQKRAWFQNSEI
ncbi:MAG: MHS family MFS transporter [Gammaproteobacteria bacterium]|nr:MHS family MFS transporter [Gammaproteobacteria bacterium]